MKNSIALLGLMFFAQSLYATNNSGKTKTNNKGNFYTYWGWNRDKYTKSNIHFTGTNYDFTLHKVKAVERQSV